MSCIKKCIGVKRGSAAAEAVDKGVEWIFENGAAYIRGQAEKQGVTVPPELDDKLRRWGVKMGLLPATRDDLDHELDKIKRRKLENKGARVAIKQQELAIEEQIASETAALEALWEAGELSDV